MLDTVTVTAKRAQGVLQNATRTVNVLTEADLTHTPSTTVNESLEILSSVDVRQRGPLDIQSDISVRGGTFDQTLILLNGIRMNDPQTGHHNMNLPITLDLIEKVEVLEGGAARVYGPNAFAGAINLQMPTQGDDMVFVHALGGQYGLFQLNSHAGFNTGSWYHLVSGSYAQSDGYINNTDFSYGNFMAQSAGEVGIGTLVLNAGANNKAFGAQNFYSSRFPDQFEATRTYFASAKLVGGSIWKYTLLAYWRQHNDRFELFRETNGPYRFENGLLIGNMGDTIPWYSTHNYHRTRVTGTEAQLKRTWAAGTTTLGFDYRNEQIASNNLGKPIDEPIPVPGEDANYTRADARDNYAAYVEHDFITGRWLITTGALLNYNSAFGWDVMPGADIGYRINTANLFYASVDRSFRLPTFTDLYYSLGGAQGSENLQPEYSLNYELGYRTFLKNAMINVALFRRQGTNMIDWVQWAPDSVHAENLTEVNMNGISARVNLPLAEKTGGWIKSIALGYTFLQADDPQSELQSLYVLDYLQHKVTANITHTLGLEQLTLDWRFSYQDRNGTYLNWETQQQANYPAFFLIDTRLSYQYKQAQFYVAASNLLNVDYVDRGNLVQPGLWVSGGVTLHFGLAGNK